MTSTPPTPSHFQDHHRLYLLPFIPSILVPCPLHLTCKQHINHPLSQYFTNVPFHSHYRNSTREPKAPIRPPVILQAMRARSRMRGSSFRFMVGRCHPPLPPGWLAPTIIACYDDFGARCFTGSMPLLTPKHSLQTCESYNRMSWKSFLYFPAFSFYTHKMH